MAIRLSSWLSLRNNELGYLTKEENKRHHKWPGISDKDIDKLKGLIKQIDKVHNESAFLLTREISHGEHHIIPITVKYEEFSKNPEMSGNLFTEIHSVLKKYRIESSIYHSLGNAFNEIGAVPEGEVAEAILYGTRMHSRYQSKLTNGFGSWEHEFCWDWVKESGKHLETAF